MRNTASYSPQLEPVIDVYNNYFGAGMSSLVFQTIRESKALAYTTYANYVTPNKKEDTFYNIAYVGCQADKFTDALDAMNLLLTQLPNVTESLNNTKLSIKKDIETARITQDDIIFTYLATQSKGINYDLRKQTYAAINNINFDTINQFYKQNIAKKPYTYCVLASDTKVLESTMAKYGEVQKLSLEEIFGY